MLLVLSPSGEDHLVASWHSRRIEKIVALPAIAPGVRRVRKLRPPSADALIEKWHEPRGESASGRLHSIMATNAHPLWGAHQDHLPAGCPSTRALTVNIGSYPTSKIQRLRFRHCAAHSDEADHWSLSVPQP